MIAVFQFEDESHVLAYVHFCVQHHFEEVKVMFLIRSQDTFSIRGQIVTILGFVGHTVFVETATIVQKQPQTICKKMIVAVFQKNFLYGH